MIIIVMAAALCLSACGMGCLSYAQTEAEATQDAEQDFWELDQPKKGKRYQERIRAFRKIGKKTYYGKWSKVKTA